MNYFLACFVLVLSFHPIGILAQSVGDFEKPNQKESTTLNVDFNVETFQLTTHLDLTIGQFESLYGETSMIEVPILLKYPLSEKLSMVIGTKFELYKLRGFMTNDFGISGSLGMQYDFNEKTFIQALFNYQLKEANKVQQIYYNSGSKASFKVRTGFKF